jgi:hypothetical protein
MRRIVMTAQDVRELRDTWPCSGVEECVDVFFEFAENGDLVDSDAPEAWDSGFSSALLLDAKVRAFLTA